MVAEAVLRVFKRYGDYEHKQRNRLKFLVKTMGWDAWFAAFEQELAEVRAAGNARLPFDPDNPPAVAGAPSGERAEAPSLAAISALVNATEVRGPGIVPIVEPHDGGPGRERTEWLRTNVQPQKQPEYSLVTVFLVLGDITAGQMRAVAALSRAYADGLVRVTVDQNLSLRWVRSGQLPGLYRRLAAAGLARAGAGTIADVTSCPGAESCRLAVTQSRGLARLIETDLREHPASVRSAPDARIKISGCPNGCGQHHVADIGFQGSIRKVGDRVVPQYFMMLGGGAGPEGASFARLTAKIPARRVPDAVERMIRLYEEERTAGETAPAFFRRIDLARAKAAVADLEKMTLEDTQPPDFIDPGEDAAFNPEVMDGECSA
jgi:sulfite reductase (NADPH) hemoprotein beta-component